MRRSSFSNNNNSDKNLPNLKDKKVNFSILKGKTFDEIANERKQKELGLNSFLEQRNNINQQYLSEIERYNREHKNRSGEYIKEHDEMEILIEDTKSNEKNQNNNHLKPPIPITFRNEHTDIDQNKPIIELLQNDSSAVGNNTSDANSFNLITNNEENHNNEKEQIKIEKIKIDNELKQKQFNENIAIFSTKLDDIILDYEDHVQKFDKQIFLNNFKQILLNYQAKIDIQLEQLETYKSNIYRLSYIKSVKYIVNKRKQIKQKLQNFNKKAHKIEFNRLKKLCKYRKIRLKWFENYKRRVKINSIW